MEGFSHHLLITLLHSLWQSAAIAILLFSIQKFFPDLHPSSLRRLSVFGLFFQILIAGFTFYLLSSPYTPVLKPGIPDWSISFYPRVEQTIILIYSGIVLFLIIHTFFSWNKFRSSIKREKVKAPFHLRLFTRNTAIHLGIKQKVALHFSANISVPVTFGMLKPVILLPVALLNHLSIKEVESIILHELQHIRAKDYIINWICIFSEIVFFFNPFILYIIKEIRQSREISCDAVVLDYKYSITDYATALLKVARMNLASPRFMLAAAGKGNGSLKRRIAFMRDRYPVVKRRNMGMRIIPFLLGIALVSVMVLSKKSNPIPIIEIDKEPVSANSSSLHVTMPNLPAIEKAVPDYSISRNSLAAKKRNSSNIQESRIPDNEAGIIQNSEFKIVPVVDKMVALPKEVTLKEEDSESGMVITSHYLISQDKDGFQLKLLWQIAEKQMPDSLRKLNGDSSIIFVPRSVQ
ncbi:MAG: M56 family metallopeptidase [Chitinophagaceae bacterium]|nr:M56 family metallopeptidase [Bacteroidota bacterium]MCC6257892.1 M56 family metallopeptidase [Chitinophagaceae bacterium]MCW5916301.1 M56 family metallopeptidase [Ferruginibacter sp.]